MSLNIDRTLRQAKQALRDGNPIAASQVLLAEHRRIPSNPRLIAALADVQKVRTGLPARPFGPAHLQRIMQIQAQAGPKAAVEEAQMAALLDPGSAIAHGLLGSILMSLSLPEAALPPLRTAFRLDPSDITAGVNLSIALRRSEEPAKAVEVARAVLKRKPGFPPAMAALAQALAEDGWPREAAEVLSKLSLLQPNDSTVYQEYAKALAAAQLFDEAAEPLRKAVKLDPKNSSALNDLGNNAIGTGDFATACEHFEAAVSAAPRIATGYYNITRARDIEKGDPIIATLRDLAENSSQPQDRMYAYFGLAKALEDIGDVDGSFAALAAANATRRAEYPFDRDQEAKIFTMMKERLWQEDAVLPLDNLAPARRRPIFILGMMRSGTTLMEQIISSHSTVYGAGELDFMGKVVRAEMRDGTAPLDRAAMGRIRKAYLDRIDQLPGDKPVLVDKMPANFILVGAIRAALPDASIIHMRRDPIAVCWSIFQKNFAGTRVRFTNDLTDIAWYYDQYADMMDFAAKQAPGAFLNVDYAELTKTPEPTIRRALDHCQLPFEAACLSPQDNKRRILTASFKQARSGIYQGSTTKWRGFEPHLKPLIDHFAK
ncbi:MAG: sulfotransferase [Paracoccaceae bacterium]